MTVTHVVEPGCLSTKTRFSGHFNWHSQLIAFAILYFNDNHTIALPQSRSTYKTAPSIESNSRISPMALASKDVNLSFNTVLPVIRIKRA